MPHPPELQRVNIKVAAFIRHLEQKNNILFLTTSNRYSEHKFDVPKTTQFASSVAKHLRAKNKRVTVIDVASLIIHPCEGNISGVKGNNCGVREAALKNKRLNPTGQHRCWASMNNPDDQLHKISRALFASQCVVFFVSVRWGQTNSMYQRLFERLSWIENRVSTLGEKPIPQLKKLEAGIVVFGQNWRGKEVVETQVQNYKWFGFKTPAALSFNWQATQDAEEESAASYVRTVREFSEVLAMSGSSDNTPAIG